VPLFCINCDTGVCKSVILTLPYYAHMPPSTRGASRALVSTASSAIMPHASPPKASRKRKAKDAAPVTPMKRTKKDPDSSGDPPTPSLPPLENASLDASDAPKIFPATLTFSYLDAKEHLLRADPRFAGLFSRLGCKPFEHLERVEPFR
jgi:DNA-3-methyladenine glycosylase II